MAGTVDFNSDLGEGFGGKVQPSDAAILPLITSANIACGFHAGDAVVMLRSVLACKKLGVAVGAHPGYPDPTGFGRRNLACTPEEARAYTVYQVGALGAICRDCGVSFRHVKLHGALYNLAAVDEALADAVAVGIAAVDPALAVFGLSGSKMLSAAASHGLKTVSEVFADRGYLDDGRLVPRSQPGAVLTDRKTIQDRVVRMVREGEVETVTGKVIPLRADSICLHGDNPAAVALAGEIRASLVAAGVRLAAPLGA